jgi:hypothetical protein
LNYGWEWAVYAVSENEVVKVPAGIFPEVNKEQYLENTKNAYQVCKQYLGDFVVDTSFERRNLNGIETNVVRQRKLNGEEIDFVRPRDLSPSVKQNFANLVGKVFTMLQKEEWIPDLHLWRKTKNWKLGWNLWNIILENNTPYIFDFTAYFDIWRLYPQRTVMMKKIGTRAWQSFKNDLLG